LAQTSHWGRVWIWICEWQWWGINLLPDCLPLQFIFFSVLGLQELSLLLTERGFLDRVFLSHRPGWWWWWQDSTRSRMERYAWRWV
jgi:hypothetical protein